ncbi:C-MYC PROMOTER BINDING PROTEIN [Salix viminalis]|uniref:C-MYC PROMOTER BINDING PROTEIN n=1 Tax=Salix viminalis TaxID=40686 RepID=A0A9Q0NVY6_SALVM|nr:C-MYC PROMOTER BINDING PROTEIN [Salix viminalis]
MGGIFEYFVACGLGSEMRTMDGNKGYHGMRVLYLPFLLDQYPLDNHSLYPPPPPQLPTCVFPAGVEFYPSGFESNHSSTFPKSYPIVFTGILRTALEELFALCFSPAGSSSIKILASHYGMFYHTWSPMYLCLLVERTWSCLPLRIACFLWRLHPKMDSPMLRYHFSHWYSVWMWTTCSNFLLLFYLKGEFYFVPTSIHF